LTRWRPYPEYKDSGMPWLGQVPSHWLLIRLKVAAGINMGQSPNSEDYNSYGDGPPFLQGNAEFGDKHPTPKLYCPTASKMASPSDLLLSVRAPVGALNIADQFYGIGRGLCAITPNPARLDNQFAWYLLTKTRIELDALATGSTYEAVSADVVRNMTCALPPLLEQRAIAAFLDHHTAKIDALIAEQRHLIELLHERRAALISHAVTKGLEPGAPMKDSGIPTITKLPAHWKVRKNKHIFDEVNERSTAGEEELLTVSHITGVTPRSEKNVYMFLAESFEDYKICRPNDLTINTMWAWMGALGITEYAGIVSPSYHVYRLKKDQAPDYFPKYLDFLYRIPSYVCEITRHSKGIWSSRLRLYPDYFFEMYTPSPPIEEQRTIATYLDRETAKIDALIAEIETGIAHLEEYRTALISAAVTGQIDVRDALHADAPARPRLTSP
jgi:type I restriction enzyme S subunit